MNRYQSHAECACRPNLRCRMVLVRVLITAFEPYDDWSQNSSWLTLVELLKARPTAVELITRRYPVDLSGLRARLVEDLQKQPDAVLHLGQAPGAASIKLEAIALNIAGCVGDSGRELPELVESGRLAYRSQMPLGRWAAELRAAGVPTVVSYHAGTFLCNATMYLTHHWLDSQGQRKPVGFVHLPLASEQVADAGQNLPSLSLATMAAALDLILHDLARAPAVEQTL